MKKNNFSSILFLFISIFLLINSQLQSSCIFGQNNTNYRVTFKTKRVPLHLALDKLAKLYKIDILYADELLEDLFVSCDLTDIPLDKVLEILLDNTDIVFKKLRTNQYVFHDINSISHFTITGSVIDISNGEKLPNTNIWIKGSHYGTTSNKEGRFVLLHVPAKLCTLQTSYIGYHPFSASMNPINLKQNILIQMHSSVLPIAPVTVKADKWEFFTTNKHPGHLSLSPKQFSDLPVLSDKDIFHSLQLIPGISANLNGASGVNIRGGIPEENLMLIDGITMYHVDHAFGLLSSLNSDIIKDIQIFKGGYPAKYGGRLSSVLDITTKSGNFHKFDIGISLNKLCGQLSISIPLGGKGAILLSGRQSYSDHLMKKLFFQLTNTPPFFPDLPPSYAFGNTQNQLFKKASQPKLLPDLENKSQNQLSQNSTMFGINFYDFLFKTTYLLTSNDILTVSLFGSNDIIERNNQKHFFYSDCNNSGASGKLYRQWNDYLETTLLGSYSEYVKNFNYSLYTVSNTMTNDPQKISRNHKSKYKIINQSINLNNSIKLNRYLSVETGFDFVQTYISDRMSYVSSTIENNQKFQQLEGSRQFSFYFQNNWQVNNKLSTVCSYRITHYNLGNSIYHEPRFSFNYDLTNNLSFKGGWGKYHQFIHKIGQNDRNIADFIVWLIADNQNIKPGSSNHKTLGLQWQNNKTLFDIEFYDNILKNRTELYFHFQDDKAFPLFQKDFRIKGIDILIKKKVGNPDFWFGYSYLNKKFLYKQYTNILPGSVKSEIGQSFKAAANFSIRNFNFILTYKYSLGNNYTRPLLKNIVVKIPNQPAYNQYYLATPFVRNQHRLPAMQQIDISTNYRFKTKFLKGKINFSLLNVLNHKNIWYKFFFVKDGKLKNKNIRMFGFTPSLSLELDLN